MLTRILNHMSTLLLMGKRVCTRRVLNWRYGEIKGEETLKSKYQSKDLMTLQERQSFIFSVQLS